MGILDRLKAKEALVEKMKEQETTIKEQAVKIAEQAKRVKALEQVQLNVQGRVYTTAELERITSENTELEGFKAFHKQLQEIFYVIRKLEIEIQRFGTRGDNSSVAKNNLLLFLMQFQSLFNLLYCSLSDSNKENQIDNFKLMKVWKDDHVKKYIDELNKIDLEEKYRLNINKGDRNTSLGLSRRIHKLFDTDEDKFPKPFFFGIEEDMKF